MEPSLTPAPSPTLPAEVARRQGLVAFTHVDVLDPSGQCPPGPPPSLCYQERLWVANADGSDAHELLPAVEGRQIALGWSPDGRWLLFDHDFVPTLTDASGSEVRPLNALGSNSGSNFAFSPDSTRLAFLRNVRPDREDAGTELAILDIASGQVVSFASTRSLDGLGGAEWSPDGQWIAFDRQPLTIPGKLFLVRADGTDLRALTTGDLPGIDPEWSPDGTALAFTSAVLVGDVNKHFVNDIYRLQLDDGDPVRLTTDGNSSRPSWTVDGRIVFNRDETGSRIDLWVMAADGSGVQHLDGSSLAALSEIGCVVCVYPPTLPDTTRLYDYEAFWKPTP